MKHLYGDIWYEREAIDCRPGAILKYLPPGEQTPLVFRHMCPGSRIRYGRGGEWKGNMLQGLDSNSPRHCHDCKKEFPPRSKLETMVGLKELTE